MIKTMEILPGVTLRCCPDSRFKQGCVSVQFLRPMSAQEAPLNALLPTVLLRGTKDRPDLRSITARLDELYGAAVGVLVRRIGDYQTTGLYFSFMEDRFAFPGDEILRPGIAFLGQLLLEPLTEQGVFSRDFVESEKKNLISAILSERNDKRVYAMGQMIRKMCAADSFGIPRLGEAEQVAKITPESLYAHYQKVLRESPINLFYVGSRPAEEVAELFKTMLSGIRRQMISLPEQSAFRDGGGGEFTEQMDVQQGKLCVGYVSPITIRDDGFAAMQVLNMIFGGGATGKLFMQVREKQSLCYDIGSGYHSSKGIVTVSAGIDFDKKEQVLAETERQLDFCRRGEFSEGELERAKQELLSGLRAVHDSPGAIENYYATAALSGLSLTPPEYMEKISRVTAEDVSQAAKSLVRHTVYFLEGVGR